MSLIIINLNSFFRAAGITKSSQISISHQCKMSQNKLLQQFCHIKTDFNITYKAGCSEEYPNYENLMLHHCCEHCQVKSIMLQMCSQTISSVLSSDDHLKPVCVCKLSLGSLHIIMNIVITAL